MDNEQVREEQRELLLEKIDELIRDTWEDGGIGLRPTSLKIEQAFTDAGYSKSSPMKLITDEEIIKAVYKNMDDVPEGYIPFVSDRYKDVAQAQLAADQKADVAGEIFQNICGANLDGEYMWLEFPIEYLKNNNHWPITVHSSRYER